jgi:monovalent cation/hydrogen antiporter
LRVRVSLTSLSSTRYPLRDAADIVHEVHETEVLIPGLLIAILVLTLLARAIGVPYPIVLVLGSLPLGYVPGVPDVELAPELVLVLFLPPLLYFAAFSADLRAMRADTRALSLSSIGLVLATTCAVAVVAHELIDGLPWAAAFALGAVVSPTDPIAATAITRQLGAPRRLVVLIEGESLINDSSALIAYRVAVAAAVGGSFSLFDASVDFVVAVVGGVAIGLVVGAVIAEIRRRLDDVPVEITVSLLTGYAAYLPAEELGVSGVLAAVTAGIYLGWLAPRVSSPEMRMQATAVWQFIAFLLNAVLFVLIGLQLPQILDAVSDVSAGTLAGYAAATIAIVVGARFVWLFTVPYVIRALDRRPSQVERRVGAAPRIVVGWAGMRGAVSLAAALAIPLETDAGAPFPERELLIFLAYCVVVFTVVVQGLTLPALIRRLGVREDRSEEEAEEYAARIAAAEAALERLDGLAGEDWTLDDTIERMRGLYTYRRRRFATLSGEVEDADGIQDRSIAFQRLQHELIDAQRAAIVRMRNERLISSDVMRRVERDLDLEESRLEA